MKTFDYGRMLGVGLALSVFMSAVVLPATAATETEIPGYRFGDTKLTRSPVSLEELDLLKQALLFTDEDVKYLRRAGEILVPQTEDILDVWYGFVGSHPHLIYYFSNKKTGEPDDRYLARVRARFGKWIDDTTNTEFDQTWLDWQHEIGVRHHVSGKNKADNAPSVDHINMRYLIAFIVPISATVKPFLQNGTSSADEVDKMYAAWTKAVTLTAILWSYPYVNDGEF